MRKQLGLAIVGGAIAACATGIGAIALEGSTLNSIAFDIAARFDSHAGENHALTFPSTLASGRIVGNFNLQGTIAFPRTYLLAINSIHANSVRHVDSAVVKIHSSDAAILSSAATLHNKALFMGNLYAQTLGQDIPATQDGERFRRIMQAAIVKNDHQRPIGEIMQAIANQFLGAAYKANLLDQSQEETLVVNLNQFDCLLFVETVLAIARGVAVQDYSYSTFVHHLGNQRYWGGQINGYCSRLHYFSQWIYDNQKRGTVQNMGQPLGGVVFNKRLNFMSSHRQRYSQMANNDTNYNCMVERETQLNGVTVDYIPTSNIRRLYSQLQPGDIIGVATSIPGLDVTHTGLVYRQPNGNIGFIHASPAGQVTIARDLQRYVSRVNNAIGILVARPLDPRQTKGTNQLGRL